MFRDKQKNTTYATASEVLGSYYSSPIKGNRYFGEVAISRQNNVRDSCTA